MLTFTGRAFEPNVVYRKFTSALLIGTCSYFGFFLSLPGFALRSVGSILLANKALSGNTRNTLSSIDMESRSGGRFCISFGGGARNRQTFNVGELHHFRRARLSWRFSVLPCW